MSQNIFTTSTISIYDSIDYEVRIQKRAYLRFKNGKVCGVVLEEKFLDPRAADERIIINLDNLEKINQAVAAAREDPSSWQIDEW